MNPELVPEHIRLTDAIGSPIFIDQVLGLNNPTCGRSSTG